jgi:hypothetical protein
LAAVLGACLARRTGGARRYLPLDVGADIPLLSKPDKANVPSGMRGIINTTPSVASRSVLIRLEGLPDLGRTLGGLELSVLVIVAVSHIARRTRDRLETVSPTVAAPAPTTIVMQEEHLVVVPAAAAEPDTKHRRRRAKVLSAA